MSRLTAKLKSKKAFSLAETMLAVLIMLLVSTIMAAGLPAAKSAYERVVIGANARSMLSTAITALHDEIGTAWKVKQIDTTTIAYFNASTGAKTQITASDNSAITIQDYLSTSTDLIHDVVTFDSLSPSRHLIPDTNSGMYVTYSGISYNNGIVQISDLQVRKGNTVLAEYKDDNGDTMLLTIRVISDDKIA